MDSITKLFSTLSKEDKKRVIAYLNEMIVNENEPIKSPRNQEKLDEKEDEKVEDGTRGDCEIEPRVSKEQLDRELDEYMCSNPRFLAFQGCTSYQYYIDKNKWRK